MKTTWSGKVQIAAARVVATVAEAIAPGAPSKPSREAVEELRRRADVNARAQAARAEREAEMFGSSRWLRRRAGWLSRRA